MITSAVNTAILKVSSKIGTLDPGSWGTGVPTDQSSFISVLQRVFTALYSIAGVACFGFLIFGGYKIIFASGDAQKFKQGTDTLVYAVIGLVIVVSTGLLFNFIGRVLGIGDIITVLSLPVK